MLAVLTVVFGVLGVFTFANLRESSHDATTVQNMKRIALAMHNHHDTFGVLPLAAASSQTTGPTQSWRVKLLPFLKESELLKKYDLQQAWDSPANLALSKTTPELFCSPLCDEAGKTPFVVIVSEQTAFPGKKGIHLKDVADAYESTILLIADLENPVTWSEPVDVTLDEFLKRYPEETIHQKGLLVAMTDAQIVRIVKASPAELRNLATISDGNIAQFEHQVLKRPGYQDSGLINGL